MPDPDRKPVIHLLPAIFTGAAALIASLTAVYVNVRNDRAAAAPAPTAQSAAPAAPADVPKAVTPPVEAPKPPERFRLQLDRIAVRHDGAMGTANWRFTVEADGEPLLAFVADDLDDTGGRNVALPKDVDSVLRVNQPQGTRLLVKAWRSRRLKLTEGPPDAIGAGVLSRDGSIAPLRVAADKPDGGEFVFFFSTEAQSR